MEKPAELPDDPHARRLWQALARLGCELRLIETPDGPNPRRLEVDYPNEAVRGAAWALIVADHEGLDALTGFPEPWPEVFLELDEIPQGVWNLRNNGDLVLEPLSAGAWIAKPVTGPKTPLH